MRFSCLRFSGRPPSPSSLPLRAGAGAAPNEAVEGPHEPFLPSVRHLAPPMGDLLILSLLVMLAGHLLLLLGATMGDPAFTSWGWLLIGLGLAVACATGIGLVRYSNQQHRRDAAQAKQGAVSRAQVEAVSRAAEASGIGLLIVERGKDAADP